MANLAHYTTTTGEELLSAYMDGTATAEERNRAEAILAADPEAARVLAGLRYTVGLLTETPRVPVPRAFTLSQSQVQPIAPRRSPWLGWLQPLYLRGAAALVAICLLFLVAGDPSLHVQLRTRVMPAPTVAQAPEGDAIGTVRKRSGGEAEKPQQTEEAIQESAPTPFAGLSPGAVRGLQVTLALLLVALLAASFYLSRLT
jgi:anti-sigma factor RsiW